MGKRSRQPRRRVRGEPRGATGLPELSLVVGDTRAARREHAFKSLLELTRELTVSRDLREAADLLLLTLMGQYAVSRSALWLLPEDNPTGPVLFCCHGFDRQVVTRVGETCSGGLLARFETDRSPVLLAQLRGRMDPADCDLLEQARIGVLAPLHVREGTLGWVALGEPLSGQNYTPTDLDVLQTSLGMVAVVLENTRLYSQMLESNRELLAANEHLRELDRLKSEFLSNVNHELRTPLAVVIGQLECLIEQGTGDEEAKEMIRHSLQRSWELNGLISNLLTFSEMRKERIPLNIAPADVGEILSAFHARRLPGVTASLRNFALEREAVALTANCDRQRLEQILDELLGNALKFTPHGCHLCLRADRLEEDGQDWVRIALADDGPGIPPARMNSLFRTFEQVDGSATRRVGGLGMGLALASQLTERMGGQLTASSALGQGSTFTLLLPVPRNRPQSG